MKKFNMFAVLPVMAMLVLFSCGDKAGNLKVTPDSFDIEASAEPVSRQVEVEADGGWSAKSDADWIDVDDVTETGFTIEVEPFTVGEDESRRGEVIVTMGTHEQRVTVTQQRYVESFVLNVSPQEIPDAEPGQEYQITVEADHAWEPDTDYEWIIIDNITDTGFTVSVEPYVFGENNLREGIVVIRSDKAEREITITQQRKVTIDAYLGIYTVSADLESNIDPSLPGGDAVWYSGKSEMVLRPEVGENVVSMQVMNNIDGNNQGTGGGTPLFFTFDPETGTLRNNNTNYPGNDVFVCTFSYYTLGANDFKKFNAIEENTLSFEFDSEGKLTIPNTYNFDGTDYRLYVLDFNPLHGLTWSMYRMYNINMEKDR